MKRFIFLILGFIITSSSRAEVMFMEYMQKATIESKRACISARHDKKKQEEPTQTCRVWMEVSAESTQNNKEQTKTIEGFAKTSTWVDIKENQVTNFCVNFAGQLFPGQTVKRIDRVKFRCIDWSKRDQYFKENDPRMTRFERLKYFTFGNSGPKNNTPKIHFEF